MPNATNSAIAPTAASILVLLAGIERHDTGAPAAIAFKAALTRKGREADAIGGAAALADLRRAVAADDPDRAADRETIITTAWAGLTGQST